MKIYITRHGQVCPKEFFGSTDFPHGDIPLSDVGKKQAICLGNQLKKAGFKGKIISSPYRRTMMTATAVSDICSVGIYPDGALREMFFSDESANEFSGMTLDELKAEFPNVADNAVLSYPWWTRHSDTNEEIIKRLEKFWDEITVTDEEEVLVVCHGASFYGTICYFNKKTGLGLTDDVEEMADYLAERNLNCGISYIEIDNDGKLVSAKLFSTEHLSNELLTSNSNKKTRPEVVEKQ